MGSAHSLIGIVLAFAAGVANAAPKGEASADQIRSGESVYARCLACHTLTYDRTDPKHCGLFGRRAGTVQGFFYSDAMKRSDIIWNQKTLDRFLADPTKSVPGTSMGYAGVKDDKERAALIAYLKNANETAECKK